jgi:predicted glycosyltransferase involved in capsule biosynthesis
MENFKELSIYLRWLSWVSIQVTLTTLLHTYANEDFILFIDMDAYLSENHIKLYKNRQLQMRARYVT